MSGWQQRQSMPQQDPMLTSVGPRDGKPKKDKRKGQKSMKVVNTGQEGETAKRIIMFDGDMPIAPAAEMHMRSIGPGQVPGPQFGGQGPGQAPGQIPFPQQFAPQGQGPMSGPQFGGQGAGQGPPQFQPQFIGQGPAQMSGPFPPQVPGQGFAPGPQVRPGRSSNPEMDRRASGDQRFGGIPPDMRVPMGSLQGPTPRRNISPRHGSLPGAQWSKSHCVELSEDEVRQLPCFDVSQAAERSCARAVELLEMLGRAWPHDFAVCYSAGTRTAWLLTRLNRPPHPGEAIEAHEMFCRLMSKARMDNRRTP